MHGKQITPGANALAALHRQAFLASKQKRVDAGLHQLTPVNPSLPEHEIYKTNPRSLGGAERSGTPRGGAAHRSTLDAPRYAAPRVDIRLPQVTAVNPSSPPRPIHKTNPNPLTPRQLAAARLIAQGCAVSRVAAELQVTRQAVWKWRRVPAFGAELLRLHELLARRLPLASPYPSR